MIGVNEMDELEDEENWVVCTHTLELGVKRYFWEWDCEYVVFGDIGAAYALTKSEALELAGDLGSWAIATPRSETAKPADRIFENCWGNNVYESRVSVAMIRTSDLVSLPFSVAMIRRENIGTFERAFREEFPSAYEFRFDQTGFLARILYPDGWGWDFYEVHYVDDGFIATARGFEFEGDMTTTLAAIRARVNERGTMRTPIDI